MIPGRSCPLHYRYAPEALAARPALATRTLIVAGGLYGNPLALAAIEDMAARGKAALVFNGDFHWFDAEPVWFADIQSRVLRHRAIAGNVEAELADASGAGCGCAYPPGVDDATVERSNRIMERLRTAVGGDRLDELATLPYYRTVQVGNRHVAIVHGDPESLAGWGLAVEAIDSAGWPQRLQDWFRRCGTDILACTHTCLPHLYTIEVDGRSRVVVNNGSAGMPNFRGDRRGLVTRVSTRPSPGALYRSHIGGVVVEAVPVAFKADTWLQAFKRLWPEGSPAHQSCAGRMIAGPDFEPAQAMGPGARRGKRGRIPDIGGDH